VDHARGFSVVIILLRQQEGSLRATSPLKPLGPGGSSHPDQVRRAELLEAAPQSVDPAFAEPVDDSAQQPALPGSSTPSDGAVATAAELAAYLAKGPIKDQQIRNILKGKEIPGRSPKTYPLAEAASALLLRKGRQTKASKTDTPKKRRSTGRAGDS